MTAAQRLLAGVEARGVRVSHRGDSLVVRPAGVLKAEERAALAAAKPEILRLLQARALGTDWRRIGLWSLRDVLEIRVPWADETLILAPGCRVARELRAVDPHPGRIWCVCEITDLLLTHVPPRDAQAIGQARLIFSATEPPHHVTTSRVQTSARTPSRGARASSADE
jgi:hypothetical protein